MSTNGQDTIKGLFREALAWGAVYKQALSDRLWDEMREEMVRKFSNRLADISAAAAPAGWSLEYGTGGFDDEPWVCVRNLESQCGQDFYKDRDPLIFGFLSALAAAPAAIAKATSADKKETAPPAMQAGAVPDSLIDNSTLVSAGNSSAAAPTGWTDDQMVRFGLLVLNGWRSDPAPGMLDRLEFFRRAEGPRGIPAPATVAGSQP